MPRALWSGTLSFGLVSIPVSLVSAKEEEPLSFHLLDRRDHARIGYRTINKATGKEVSRDQIVRAYEYEKDQFVVVRPEDFERANPKATKTIDLEDFVPAIDLDPLMLEKPYYLIPAKNGEKPYLLLKKVLENSGRVALGRFVLRQKQKLVAVIPRGDYLVLEILRYAREVLTPEELSKVGEKLHDVKLTPRELEMASQLVKNMSAQWKPEKYKDTYTEDFLKFMEIKARRGEAVAAAEAPNADFKMGGKVVDLMPLLKRSLQQAKGNHGKGPTSSRQGVRKTSARRSGASRKAAPRRAPSEKSSLH